MARLKDLQSLDVDLGGQDIANGVRRDGWRCPVTLATQRALRRNGFRTSLLTGVFHVFVGHRNGQYMKKAWMPDEVFDAVARFDKTGEMQPFKFTLQFVNADA